MYIQLNLLKTNQYKMNKNYFWSVRLRRALLIKLSPYTFHTSIGISQLMIIT